VDNSVLPKGLGAKLKKLKFQHSSSFNQIVLNCLHHSRTQTYVRTLRSGRIRNVELLDIDVRVTTLDSVIARGEQAVNTNLKATAWTNPTSEAQ
jgi:hypothetical protein